MPRIQISFDSYILEAKLADSDCARALLKALPLEGDACLWGKEIYFAIPIEASLETGASDQLPAGSLAFWPPGNAFCIIWGPTPASHENEPRFASPVNYLGKIYGDFSALDQIREGDTLSLSIP